MSSSISRIYIITDFGSKDYYVAAMKTVLLDLCPKNIVLIDVTHEIEPGNILDASFVAWQLSLVGIRNSGVLVVVDPGVGTERDALLIECEGNNVLVGPDNGVLHPLANTLGIKRIYSIESSNERYFKSVSKTFHGRDIFAKALGLYCRGIKDFLKEKEKIVASDIFVYTRFNDKIIFKVLHVDRFGNVITNIPCFEELPEEVGLWVKGKVLRLSVVETFSDLDIDELGILCGSSGFYEIVKNLSSAYEVTKLKSGDTSMILLQI